MLKKEHALTRLLVWIFCLLFAYLVLAAVDGMESLSRMAGQGNADAQFMMAVAYSQGDGKKKDEALALFWYHAAAEQNHVEAQSALGNAYANGLGVTKNETQAASGTLRRLSRAMCEPKRRCAWPMPTVVVWPSTAATSGLLGQ